MACAVRIWIDAASRTAFALAIAMASACGIVRSDATASDPFVLGGPGHDLAIALSSDGATHWLAGEFHGRIDAGIGTLESAGAADVVLVRIGARGVEHAVAFGGAGVDLVRALALVNGAPVLCGAFGGDFAGLADAGQGDAYVLATDRDGAIRYARRFGGKFADGCRALAPAGAGEVYAGGQFQLTGNFAAPGDAPDVRTSRGASDLWLTRLRADGRSRWTRTLGGVGSDELVGLADDSEGGVWLLALFAGELMPSAPGEMPMRARGDNDVVLARIDGEGTMRLARAFGHGGADQPIGIAPDGRGGVWIAANLAGAHDDWRFGDDVRALGQAGVSGAYVVRVDAEGALVALRAFGTAGGTLHLQALTAAGEGGVWLAGAVDGRIDIDGRTMPAEATDALVLRLDGDGRTAFAEAFGGPGIQAALTVADIGGRALAAGLFEGALRRHGRTRTGAGKSDIFVTAVRAE